MARPKLTPASRTEHAALTTERVLTAALAILDTEGVEALSMRRLAHALDRKAMTLYRYTSTKTALLDGVVELVLRDLHIDPAAADWRQELRCLARAFRRLALAHPNVVPLLVTRPLATPRGLRPPGSLRPLEDVLALLTGAGFSPTDALHAARLFFGFLHGHVLDELQEIVENPEEADDLFRLGLHRLSPREFPQLRGLAAALAGYDGAAQLDQGVEMMITGLEAHFHPHAPQTHPPVVNRPQAPAPAPPTRAAMG